MLPYLSAFAIPVHQRDFLYDALPEWGFHGDVIAPLLIPKRRDLRSRIGESLRSIARAPSLENATTSSLAALRDYSLAVQIGDIEADFEGGLTHWRLAVREDSTFAQAWRKMAVNAFTSVDRDRNSSLAPRRPIGFAST